MRESCAIRQPNEQSFRRRYFARRRFAADLKALNKAALAILCALYTPHVFAADLSARTDQGAKKASVSVTLEPFAGVSWGTLDEYIYSSNTGNAVSLLEWEQKPLFRGGLGFRANGSRFNFRLAGSAALPLPCGSMYDSDYNPYSGIKNKYSVSENTAVAAFSAETEFSVSLKLRERFTLTPLINAQYSYDSVEARNGYGWYSGSDNLPYTDSSAKYYEKGQLYGADYSRHTLYFFAGLGARVYPAKRLSFECSLMVSPFTYTFAIDHHLSGDGGYYWKQIQYAWFSRLYGSLAAYWALNASWQAGISVTGLYAWTARGTLYSSDDGVNYYEESQQCGAAARKAAASVSIRWKPFASARQSPLTRAN